MSTPAPTNETHAESATQSAPGWTWGLLFLILLLLAATGGIRGCSKKAEAEEKAAEVVRQKAIAFAKAHPVIVEFPKSGGGYATNGVGIKAYLDPKKTHTRRTRPARYEFVKDPEKVFFESTEPGIKTENEKWKNMPPGEYIVYPIEGEWTYFWWWQ